MGEIRARIAKNRDTFYAVYKKQFAQILLVEGSFLSLFLTMLTHWWVILWGKMLLSLHELIKLQTFESEPELDKKLDLLISSTKEKEFKTFLWMFSMAKFVGNENWSKLCYENRDRNWKRPICCCKNYKKLLNVDTNLMVENVFQI